MTATCAGGYTVALNAHGAVIDVSERQAFQDGHVVREDALVRQQRGVVEEVHARRVDADEAHAPCVQRVDERTETTDRCVHPPGRASRCTGLSATELADAPPRSQSPLARPHRPPATSGPLLQPAC